MTLHVLNPPSATARFRDTDDLIEALGIGFSDQQLDAITAPLEPGVIIAGAGSGKTTVMAARVVWLVGTGAVRPEEVLGLTFTRKAAAELSHRVRTALLQAGVIADRGRRRVRRAVDHDLRRVRGPAGRRARSAARVRGGSDDDHRRHALPAGVSGGEVGRRPVRVHLPAAAGHGHRAGAQARLGPATASGRSGPAGSPCPRPADRAGIGADEPARECLRRRQAGHHQRPGTPRAGQSGAGLPAPEGAPRAGRVRRPDGHRGPAGHRGAAGLDRAALGFPGGVAGRVPGHLGGPGDHAPRAVLRLDAAATDSAIR